jgi:hypothetical protein
MPEEQTQSSESPQIAAGTRSPVEKPVSVEVAPSSQDKDIELPDYGALVQESKKYRKRAQESEAELGKLQKKLDTDRQKQMEEQNKWQELAEERAVKLAELEPIVEKLKADENEQRELILSDFSEEDRQQFSDLSLSQLRVLHRKLFENKNNVVGTDGTPARTQNVQNKPWTEMSDKERKANWGNIVQSYVRK